MSTQYQAQGFLGLMVDGMIRRNVKKVFHAVYWRPPQRAIPEPCIIVPNHHGWHDGYVMYLALTRLGMPFLDWIAEYDAFPLFGKVGGMPFPPGDGTRRAITVKRTIREMRAGRNLLLFAESHLHRPPELLPFGESLKFVADKVPGAVTVPVAIRYESGMHERPEVFLAFGDPIANSPDLQRETRLAVSRLLDQLSMEIRHQPEAFELLHAGTLDVNERLDVRKFQFWRRDK